MEKSIEINERNKRLGSQLQKYRTASCVTQEEMSKFSGVSKNHLSKIEQGVYKCPANLLIDYAKRLNISLDVIAEFKPQENKDSHYPDNIMPELLYEISSLSEKKQKLLLAVLQTIENQI